VLLSALGRKADEFLRKGKLALEGIVHGIAYIVDEFRVQ